MPAASARMPSSAISAMIGLPSCAYSPSAACAIALSPLVTLSGDRQRQRQLGVVDHRLRQHARVASGLLHAAFGDAVDRRHLAAGVGGRNRRRSAGPLSSAIALPSPSSSRRRSRPRSRRRAAAPRRAPARAASIGTCITARAKMPAARAPSISAMRARRIDLLAASTAPARVARRGARSRGAAAAALPAPKTTRGSRQLAG